MNFVCERCGHRYEIDFISYMPECPRCQSSAAEYDDGSCRNHPDRALPELLVSDALLFLGALWLITGDCE